MIYLLYNTLYYIYIIYLFCFIAEYNANGRIIWDNDEVTLYSPTVKQCEKVMDDLAKQQPTRKQWSIGLNASNPASTRVVIRNLHKCVVTGLKISLATPNCVSALSEILPANNTLKMLNLSLYPNTRDVIKEMSSSLSTNTSLEILLFSSLDVTEEDLVCLSEVLAVNKTLRKLSFSHSNITDKNFKYICEALTKNRTLNILEISKNPEITSESTDTIVSLLETTTSLAELCLLKNSLKIEDVGKIVNALVSNDITKLIISKIYEESCKELDCYVLIKDKVVFLVS